MSTKTAAVRAWRDDSDPRYYVQAADDPDIDVLAQLLVERRGQGKSNDLDRRSEARRLLHIFRGFQNRIRARSPVDEAAMIEGLIEDADRDREIAAEWSGGGLDRAWAAAEAEWPEESTITFFPSVKMQDGSRTEWTVRVEKQVRFGGRGRSRYARAYADGPTPAEALRQLAAKLREPA